MRSDGRLTAFMLTVVLSLRIINADHINRTVNNISSRLLLHRFIMKLFQELDSNRDGSLTSKELEQLRKSTFTELARTDLDRFFREADSDKTGEMRTTEFREFLKLVSPALFDVSRTVANDDFEYFHQQLISATPQTEYDEEDAGSFEMVEHVPRPEDIPIENEHDARRVLTEHSRNISILGQADLDNDQRANFSETLRLVSLYQKVRNSLNFLKLYIESELDGEGQLSARGLSQFVSKVIERCEEITNRANSQCHNLHKHTLGRKVDFSAFPSDHESLIALVLHTVPNTYYYQANEDRWK